VDLAMLGTPSAERLLAAPAQAAMDRADPDAAVPPDPALPGLAMGSALSKAIACVCCPNILSYCAWCTQVDQNEQKAVLYWGQYQGTLTEPGLYCVNPWGRELRTTSTKFRTMELQDVKVVDARGNPVVVSGVLAYYLNSARRATVDVEDPTNYIRLQATAALKQIAGRYPYSAAPGQPSLQTEGGTISAELSHILQLKVSVAGAVVKSFELVDLSYAPEIAQTMLVKQQAEALVEARRLLVGSAVDMAHQAVEQLQAKGCKLSDTARERVTSNLLAVICSHTPAAPMVPLQS